MSYYYQKYEWTAFREADLLKGKDTNFSKGDSFTMGTASVTMSTYDNDSTLSGGKTDWWCRTYSADQYGQDATVENCRVGCKMYAERYHVLQGSDGKTYYLIEIAVEGHDAPGAGSNYLTFYGAQPPAGTVLTSQGTCEVSGSWIDYSCLGAGTKVPPNTPPTFTNIPADGMFCVDENTKLVIDLDAKDADCDTLSFSLVGGADGAAFQIDPKTGVLTFKAAPDYEAPTDADGNNVYKVIVAVSDGKGGVTNKELSVCVKDVAETSTCVVIEAEDMQLCGYRVDCASSASGGEYIGLNTSWWGSSSGYAQTKFEGVSGEYDLSMRYWDGSGDGLIKIYVNGCEVGSVRLNDSCGWKELSLDGLDINKGDVITLKGYGNCSEGAIIDKIKLCPTEPEPQPGALEGRVFVDANKDGIDNSEAGVAGVTVQLLTAAGVLVATTTTDANGGYAFTGLDAGDYKVAFPTSVDGRVLTQQNVGADDTIDSDANVATGQTGNYAVVAGETTKDVDAGLIDPNHAPDAMDDAAKTCADEAKTVDVLANDSDSDGDTLTITSVGGKAIAEGGSVNVDGVTISLVSGKLVIDGSAAHADLEIGQSVTASYGYTVSDGNGGTDSATLDMTFCGATNTLETIAASLPEGGTLLVSFSNVFGGDFATITVSGTGDERFDGISFGNAYCVSLYEPISTGVLVPYNMYLATEDSVPTGVVPNPENLDMINWILNQDFASMDNGDGNGQTYTEAEIQGAIWALTDDIIFVNSGQGTKANVQEIYDLALANGEGFEAGEGDIVGLILDPTDAAVAVGDEQPLIIGVHWDDLAQDCLCV